MAHKLVCDNFYPEQKKKQQKLLKKSFLFMHWENKCEEK